MSTNEEIASLYSQYVMNTYVPSLTLVSGKGCKVKDADRMQYLDFTGGIAVQATGHCHPKVVAAIQDQAQTLVHCSNLFYNVNQCLLAKKLSEIGLGGKVFFCNSGAEANEAMIKLARLWGHESGRYEVICMQNSFHGRTLATLSATGQSKVQAGFDPLMIGFRFAEYNNLDSVKALVGDKTVAILLEAVQGEGGVLPATDEFLRGVRALCDERNLLMLCDEVQCGMGRTGKWFAWEHAGIRPDACTLAKALGAGLPIGALLATPRLSNVFTPGSHGSTFGGNPLATAAALAQIQVIEEEGLIEHADEMGRKFREALAPFVEKYDDLLEVRGRGLMVGLVVKGSAKEVAAAFREQCLLCCVAGEHVLRFLPPLNVTEDELEEGVEMMSYAFEELYGEA
jgi:predicted acetylornithine/succinylornithine family transaminase